MATKTSSETVSDGFHVTVIGLGAMGGGMARAILESSVAKTVVGYDVAVPLVDAFHEEALALGKTSSTNKAPVSLEQAVTRSTQFVVVVLNTEPQCQDLCFGSSSSSKNLLDLTPKGSCVILCSTVTAGWTEQASHKFAKKGILFVDSPISGGPVRARAGDLTMMASGTDASLDRAHPVLEAMSREGQLYTIQGGAGMGQQAKMVHQLLAATHVVAAAEALALAAKAGLDVEQVYDIVNGAAGASWMFKDRGQRMIQTSSSAEEPEVKGMVSNFVKDLGIITSEAKRLQVPVPLATSTMQQFIAAQALGLNEKDDSQVVKVYTNVTGVPVQAKSQQKKKEGNEVGDVWVLDDQGRAEEIMEVGSEPRHHVVMTNEYVRVIEVRFPAGDTTVAHRHEEDSLYFFLVPGGLDIINHVKGSDPACDCAHFGEIRYGDHKTTEPLVHKVTNRSSKPLFCIDAEVLKKPPVTSVLPLIADKHELVKERNKCRVYKLTLEPGESVTVTYSFFHFTVVLEPSTIEKEIVDGRIKWTEPSSKLGDVSWKEPVCNLRKSNVGTTTFVEYICEWC